jgi:hypothetical protein
LSGSEVAAAWVVADEVRESPLLLGDRASAAPELELVRTGLLETLKLRDARTDLGEETIGVIRHHAARSSAGSGSAAGSTAGSIPSRGR